MHPPEYKRAVDKGLARPTGSEIPAERRPKRRKSVLTAGIVASADGTFNLNCTIRDLSESGARLAMPRNAKLPASFYLIDVRERLAYEAATIWNNGTEAGVKFGKTQRLADVGTAAQLSDPPVARAGDAIRRRR